MAGRNLELRQHQHAEAIPADRVAVLRTTQEVIPGDRAPLIRDTLEETLLRIVAAVVVVALHPLALLRQQPATAALD